MAIAVPENRKCHIARIFGTNKSGERVTDIWVDVLRIDEIKIKTQDALHHLQFTNQFQESTLRLKWRDESGEEGFTEENNSGDKNIDRQVRTVKVCSPDEDFTDPTEWVPISIIKNLPLTASGGNVKNIRNFLTRLDGKTSNRKVEKRRSLHHDTNIDSDADSSDQKVFVTPANGYELQGDGDESDYVEHEVIINVGGQATHHWLETAGDDLKNTVTFKNEFLLDISEEAKEEETGPDGYDPPYRLDLFQNIINCKFGEPDQQYMVSTQEREGLPFPPPTSDFGGYVSGASLGNITVMSLGYVAAGKIEIEPGVKKRLFVHVPWQNDENGGVISIGTPNSDGGVDWVGAGEFLGRATAASYANERFFITSTKDGVTTIKMTSDGQTFSSSQPWGDGSGDDAPMGAGNVAYLDGTYVTMGDVGVDEEREQTTTFIFCPDPPGCSGPCVETVFDQNLAWATSGDGISWSVNDGNKDLYNGISAGFRTEGSNVAAGNGVFVAACNKKRPTDYDFSPSGGCQCCILDHTEPTIDGGTFDFDNCCSIDADRPTYLLSIGAVAVSKNGRSWTVVTLPGATANGSHVAGDTASQGTLVTFVRDKKAAGNQTGPDAPTGYFVATMMQQGGSVPGFGTLYKSVDGYDWSALEGISEPEIYYYLSAVAKDIKNLVIK